MDVLFLRSFVFVRLFVYLRGDTHIDSRIHMLKYSREQRSGNGYRYLCIDAAPAAAVAADDDDDEAGRDEEVR